MYNYVCGVFDLLCCSLRFLGVSTIVVLLQSCSMYTTAVTPVNNTIVLHTTSSPPPSPPPPPTHTHTVVRQFQSYVDPEVTTTTAGGEDEGVALPLGDTTLICNMGMPVIVVCCKVGGVPLLQGCS